MLMLTQGLGTIKGGHEMTTGYELDMLEDDVPSEIFSFRESLKTRGKELRHSISLLRKSPLFLFGFGTILALVIIALLAPYITPYGPREFLIDPLAGEILKQEPPGAIDTREYLLWTDFSDVSAQFGLADGLLVRTWLVDLNNDTKVDFLIGTSDSRLLFYQNVGTGAEATEWELNTSFTFPEIPENVTHVSPTTGDMNRDNVTDIMIGGNDGFLYRTINRGTPSNANWTDFSLVRNETGAVLEFPGQAHPTLVNFDRDGNNKTDLVVGSTDNKLYVYINEASIIRHEKWELVLLEEAPLDIYDDPLDFEGLGTGSIKADFLHINPTESWDMIVIFDSGHYYYYTSIGLKSSPSFLEMDKDNLYVTFTFPTLEEVPGMDFQWYDFNHDNISDLFVFYSEGNVRFAEQYKERDGRPLIFGTDALGGDIFSRCIWALQLDLILAIWVVLWALVVGTIVGSIAGYYGGWIDNLMMRITDVFFAFPGLILAMAIAAALGKNMFNLSIALIAVWWAGYARISRGQVLSEKNKLYVEAARAVGLSNTRIIFRHVLPNSLYPLLVAATLDLGGVVLTAAGLSFIGFGANPGDAELGRMIADGREYFIQAPWLVFFPGLVIFLIVLAFNLIGDGLRDVMDPKIRR